MVKEVSDVQSAGREVRSVIYVQGDSIQFSLFIYGVRSSWLALLLKLSNVAPGS